MTFTEAAVEVLRLVGKPLHYKKITEVAIERNLLSHVGKTPEVTMSSRLATMVKRDRGEAPIIKVKPGVFGLREFNEEQLADLSGDVDELPEVEVETEQDKASESPDGSVELPSISPPVEPRKPLPGADVFPEEDDDDEPILGGDDDDDDDEEGEGEDGAAAGASPGAESRSSRRRRKRRRRGGADDAPEVEAPRAVREPREEAPRQLREPREARNAREPRRDEGRARGRNDRSLERTDRGPDRGPDRGNDRGQERGQDRNERHLERGRDQERYEREEPVDFHREPGDGDLLGKDLADAVASVLSQGSPRGLPAMRIADMLVRKGRLAGEPSQLVPTVMASVRADIARKRIEQTRPRFRLEGGAVTLTEFLLPQDVLRAEQDVLRAAERQRERTRRAFVRKLSELPGAGMAELIATWLNAEGVVGLRAVRRPGAGVGELHLAGTLRRGADEVRLAIVVYREARELSRDRVIEARGSLHYYGNASLSWLVTFGTVTSGAREEASAPAAGPVALYDGLALATAMERQGVGLVTQQVAISALDFELLESLRGGVVTRDAPRDLDQERGRGRERDRGERDRGERDRGERDRGERDRGERAERGERDRGEPRNERERPRLQLERARPSPLAEDEIEVEQVEDEVEDDAAIDEGDEIIEAVLQEADASGEAGSEDGAEREGGRRRRRRRRRKGGRGGEAQATGDAAPGDDAGEGGEADGFREDGESEERGEGDEYAAAGEHGESLTPRESAEARRQSDDDSDSISDTSDRDDRDHDDHDGDDDADEDERDADDEQRERDADDEQRERDGDDRDDDERDDERDDDDSDDDERDDDQPERSDASRADDDSSEQGNDERSRPATDAGTESRPDDEDDDRDGPYSGRRGHG
jgi:hypothetical protein